MRNPKHKSKPGQFKKEYVSPFPQSYPVTPQNLKRSPSTASQKNWAEDTIIYGDDDALPLRIAKLVQDSPATSACLKTISQFIKGSSFSDKSLMKVKINGTQTLWDLHCWLSDTLPIFEGFSVNFKYNANNKITLAYPIEFESCRFLKPEDTDPDIKCIVYNPYFGTAEYQKKYTQHYPVFNISKIQEEVQSYGAKYRGQIYYYGKTKPLYRFYPVPDYWSAKKWIEIDAKIQEFHAENLENGFFQSVLMTVIGNPNDWSKNPRLQETYDDNGVKKTRSTKTVGEEFNDQMSNSFSGSKKAGNVMVQWALNQDQIQKIQAFPNNTNADLFIALQDLTTKNLTIATGVPSILANISEGVSLGSAGSEIQKAIELMQSRVAEWQSVLVQFYNEILLPNLESPVTGRVDIVNFTPVSQKIEIEDKFWDVLNENEKRNFIRKSFPNIQLDITPVTQTTALPGSQAEQKPIGNEALRSLKLSEIQRIQAIVAKFNKGILTYDQAKQFLLGYGLTEEDIPTWLVTPDEV